MSENDNVEGGASRRTVLKGVGGAIATAGVSRVATANVPDDADMVEIPKAARGTEVIRYKEVPKKFWNHLTAAREQATKLSDRVDGALGVNKRPIAGETVAGRKKRKLIVTFPDREALEAARVPDEADGFPVEAEVQPDFEPGQCDFMEANPFYQGGTLLLRLDDHPDAGTCYSTGHGWGAGTAGCVVDLGYSGRHILTANHLFDPADTCGNVPNRIAGVCTDVDGDGSTEKYVTGDTTYYADPQLDYMFVDNTNKSCWQGDNTVLPMSQRGNIYTDTGEIEIRGYTINLDEDAGTSTTFYRSGHKSGHVSGTLRDTTAVNAVCVDNPNMFRFDMPSAGGDSGSVYYNEFYDPEQSKYVAEIAALHTGHSRKSSQIQDITCTYCGEGNITNTQYSVGFGTSAEDIQNDTVTTVYYGGK